MIGRLIHTVTCLFRKDCEVFSGDWFSRWLDRQYRESADATAELRRARQRRQNPFESDVYPDIRRKEDR